MYCLAAAVRLLVTNINSKAARYGTGGFASPLTDICGGTNQCQQIKRIPRPAPLSVTLV